MIEWSSAGFQGEYRARTVQKTELSNEELPCEIEGHLPKYFHSEVHQSFPTVIVDIKVEGFKPFSPMIEIKRRFQERPFHQWLCALPETCRIREYNEYIKCDQRFTNERICQVMFVSERLCGIFHRKDPTSLRYLNWLC
jgi:hypothetical protein